jgi:hypothetical protein
MAEWAVLTGFYTEDQLAQDIYTQAVTTLPRPPLVAFWDYLTDHRHHFGKSNGSVSHLRDPMHRILHHIIARTICPRDLAREKVNLGDIFHLYCLLTGRRANLADSLAQFLAGAHHRKQAGALYGGSFVTYLARRLMFEPSLDDQLEAIAPETFGRTNLLAMGIVGRFDPPRLVSDTRALLPFEPEDIPPVAEIPDYRELGDGRPDPDHSPLPRHHLFAPPGPQQPPQVILSYIYN